MERKKISHADVANIILLNERNEVMIQKKDLGYPWFPGGWCLPGGKIEPGENPEQCIRREMQEEYTFAPDDLHFFMSQEYEDKTDNSVRKGRQHSFYARYHGKISDWKVREGAGFAFFAESELGSIPIVEHDLVILRNFYQIIKNP